jgi:signal transduction histidine kinase/ActR/RegA family two-component response regulator
MFGYTLAEIAANPFRILENSRGQLEEAYIAQIRAGETLSSRPIRCVRKDGKRIECLLSARQVQVSDGEIGRVIVYEDVTERRNLETMLLQAQKMEAIGQLTGGLAHDFNNILMIVMGNISILRDSHDQDESIQELANEALIASQRGAELTRSLLAFARQQPLQPKNVDVNEIVSNIAKLLTRILGQSIEISLDLGDNIATVMVDPVQLETTLTNLATNARDAMPKGGTLSIATANRHLDADYAETHAEVNVGDYAMIQVSDSGSGMPPEVVQRIFEPFFTTKGRGHGTGLGLSMVYGFIKQSGGHINAYSEVGVGTTFRLYLPAVSGTEPNLQLTPRDELVRGNGERILVVEDDPGIRRVVVRLLKDLGYAVLEAQDGSTALKMLESGTVVDLVFTDIVMAGRVDGLDLAEVVRQLWPSTSVLVTSGFPGENMENSLLANGLRLLSKPYLKSELARAVNEALAGRAPSNADIKRT